MNSLRSTLVSISNLKLPVVALALVAAQTTVSAAEDFTGWSVNLTPVLIVSGDDDLGGGMDPEVQYTTDLGSSRLGAGLRIGGYYARERFGVVYSPTLRLTVPVGKMEPYVSFGMGYGWIPDDDAEGVSTMSRTGVVYRVRRNLAIGLETTVQKIDGANWSFPSIGSMMAFEL